MSCPLRLPPSLALLMTKQRRKEDVPVAFLRMIREKAPSASLSLHGAQTPVFRRVLAGERLPMTATIGSLSRDAGEGLEGGLFADQTGRFAFLLRTGPMRSTPCA